LTRKAISFVFALTALTLTFSPLYANNQASPQLQAAIIIKLLPLYNNLGNKEFRIHVVGAPELAKLLEAKIGSMAGKAKLISVTSGDTLPGEVDVVYLGKNLSEGTQFTQKNHVLSITGNPDMISKGVSLGIGIENSKPRVYLNLKASKAEGVDWDPQILKVAKMVG